MLFERLKVSGDRPALYTLDGQVVTYADLERLIAKFIDHADLSVNKGLFLLEAVNSVASIVAYIAALRTQCPVIIVDHSESVSWDYYFKSYPITHSFTASKGYKFHDNTCQFDADLAVLLSTSGSTGHSKLVMLSRRNIESNANSIIDYLDLNHHDISPTTLSYSYSYGLSVLNTHLKTGAALLLTDKSVIDSDFWLDFSKFNCTGLAGVPHTYELIKNSEIDINNLANLRYMTQAGGRLEPSSIEYFHAISMHGGWDFYVMYGQTEATARIAYLPPTELGKNLDCVGRAIPGGIIELIDTNGVKVSREGESGELVYSGPNVMLGYANSSEDLLMPSRPSELHTGDLGEYNENGFLKITGRLKRIIKPFGLRVNLDDLEHVLTESGYNLVCTGDDRELILFSTENYDSKELVIHVSELLNIPAKYIRYVHIEEVPRLSSGKVNYNALHNSHLQFTTESPSEYGSIGSLHSHDKVIDIYTKFFLNREIRHNDSFESLGGDSLNFIAVSTQLKNHLGTLPVDWHKKSIDELEEYTAKHKSKYLTDIDTNVLLRAMAIILIVLGHLDIYHYGGTASLTLFVLAGFAFSKYTLPAVRATGTSKPIISLISKVALLIFAYLFAVQLMSGKLDPPSLLFISNYFDPSRPNAYINWFVEIYIQLLLIFIILFSSKQIRTIERQNSYWFYLVLTVFYMALLIGIPKVWDTDYLYNRVPHMLAWLFTFGCVVELSKTATQKTLTLVLFLIGYYFDVGLEPKFLLFAGLILMFTHRVYIPRFTELIFIEIAGASLFIYTSHMQFNRVVEILGFNSVVGATVAIVMGVIGWKVYLKVLELLGFFYQKYLTRT